DFPERLARVTLVAPHRDLAHVHARFVADQFHRFDKVEPQIFLDEGEDVARFTAHEALEPAASGPRKVRILAVMKRAGSTKTIPDAFKLHVLADDGNDV